MDARADSPNTRDVDAALGWHVKRLRRARGLTQEQLAERCGLSSDTIRRLEHGSFSPSLDTLTKLCEGLSLTLSTLFTVFEMAERDDLREIIDLLASRPLDQYRLVHRVLLTLFAELDRDRRRGSQSTSPVTINRATSRRTTVCFSATTHTTTSPNDMRARTHTAVFDDGGRVVAIEATVIEACRASPSRDRSGARVCRPGRNGGDPRQVARPHAAVG